MTTRHTQLKETVLCAGSIVILLAVMGWMGYRDEMAAQSPQSALYTPRCPPPLFQQELIGSGHVETDGARVLRCVYVAVQ